jgi:hypothetical protein
VEDLGFLVPRTLDYTAVKTNEREK